ncbi:gp16 family protein [Tianweitania sediminis]|uniref:Regulatory protein GemA n=1 Tax=Tianweitania sediminis TaxID=1502156 RepID=A0A8J7RLN3_9HYPH|nr:regulatory protein GemA [Tianweitania sediminis]MBP0439461.1 regulatory protein GemA [Tianweitania sediminis]
MSALAAIHVAKKQLGLDEDTFRAVCVRVTGKSSTREMNDNQRNRLIEEFRRQGFQTASKGSRKRLEGKFAPKLQALWIAAWNLGIVRDRSDDALVSFVKRQTGIDHVRFVRDAEDAIKAIEALKRWMEREAGVDWSADKQRHPIFNDDRFRVAWAQFRKIVPGATLMGNGPAFLRLVKELTGHEFTTIFDLHPEPDMSGGEIAYVGGLPPADWLKLMNALGERIRRQQGGERRGRV